MADGPFRLHNFALAHGLESASGYDSVAPWRSVNFLYTLNHGPERYRWRGGPLSATDEPDWDRRLGVYENPHVMPRAFIVYRTQVVSEAPIRLKPSTTLTSAGRQLSAPSASLARPPSACEKRHEPGSDAPNRGGDRGVGDKILKFTEWNTQAPLAQLDRASASGAEGQWFESTVARDCMGRNLFRFLG